MRLSDLLRLPPGVKVFVAVMLWPAIWAAAAMVMALTTDNLRRLERLFLSRVTDARRES